MYKKKNVKTAFVYKTLIYIHIFKTNQKVETKIFLLNCEQFI